MKSTGMWSDFHNKGEFDETWKKHTTMKKNHEIITKISRAPSNKHEFINQNSDIAHHTSQLEENYLGTYTSFSSL